jgi:uncharacterized membrane protein
MLYMPDYAMLIWGRRIIHMNRKGLAGLIGVIVAGPAAAAATLIPIPPVAGAKSEFVYGINDNEVIVGKYEDSAFNTHGFFGTLDGNYTTFDYSEHGPVDTQGRGISNDGHIAGFAGDGATFYAFVRNPDGSFMTVTRKGAALDGGANGILDDGTFVGFREKNGFGTPYLGKDGAWVRDLQPFPYQFGSANGIDEDKAIVGDYCSPCSGFILQDDVATQVVYPGATETVLAGINVKGQASGTGYGNNALRHADAFVFDTHTGEFTKIKVLDAKHAEAEGLNNAGLVVIDTEMGNFIYCPHKPDKCPAGGIEIAE